jgi:hypothetical protein
MHLALLLAVKCCRIYKGPGVWPSNGSASCGQIWPKLQLYKKNAARKRAKLFATS